MVENTTIKKLSDVSIAVCLYLFLLDAILQQGWSGFVVPIVFFSDLLLIGFIYLAFSRASAASCHGCFWPGSSPSS